MGAYDLPLREQAAPQQAAESGGGPVSPMS